MRTLLAIAVLLLPQVVAAQGGGRGGRGGDAGAAAQPVAPPNPGFECFDRVETPEFPKAALQDHVDGSVWLWVQVAQGGTAGKIDTQVVSAYGNGPALLTPAVEKAVKASTFKPDCVGKTVAVVYRYQLYGEAMPNPMVTTRKEMPNILWIESHPQTKPAATTGANKK